MKKIFAFAIAAVTMTVGCQKIQELVNPDRNQTSFDDNEPVEITFNTNVVNVETKAALTELTAEETLYIYGLNTTKFEEGKAPTDLKEIINAAATSTAQAGDNGAAGETATITWKEDVHYYYRGTTDTYDFYGYYVGSAVTGEPAPDENTYELPVTITGQEDILLAKALGSESGHSDAYSAKTAREGLIPSLKFMHQLSQFTFTVTNGGKTDMTLKGISINTINEGTLTVAGENAGLVAGTTTGDLFLPGISDKTLTGKLQDGNDTPATLEGSIMAFPQESYTVNLYLHQTGAVANGNVRMVSIPVKFSDGGAVAGTSYELSITIYSLEEVELEATLVGWSSGANVSIDSENTDDNANVGGKIEEDEVGWNDDNDKPETPTPTPTPTPTTPEFAATAVEDEIAADVTTFKVNVTLDGEALENNDNITVDYGGLEDPEFNAGAYTFIVPANEGAEDVVYNVTFTYGTQEKTVTVTHKAPVAEPSV